MKTISTLFLALFPSCYLFSQLPLTTSNNTLRHGDILCKIGVPYVEQGDRGSNAVWYLPEIPEKGKDAIAMETMKTEINTPYSLLFSNCAHSVQKTLQTIGLSPGYFMSASNNNNIFPSQEEFIIRNVLPIKIFENIKLQNSGRKL